MKSYQNTIKTLNFVSIRVHSWSKLLPFYAKQTTFVESPLQIHPFYAKRTQFPSFLLPKQLFAKKRTQNEPKQTQTKPILP